MLLLDLKNIIVGVNIETVQSNVTKTYFRFCLYHVTFDFLLRFLPLVSYMYLVVSTTLFYYTWLKIEKWFAYKVRNICLNSAKEYNKSKSSTAHKIRFYK